MGSPGGGARAVPAARLDDMAAKREAFIAAERARQADAVHDVDPLEYLRNRPATPAQQAPRYHGDMASAYAEAKRDNMGGSQFSDSFGPAKLQRSVGLAYVLWFFAGPVAGHRIYLGAMQSAAIQAAFLWFGIALLFTQSAFVGLGVFFLLLHGGWRFVDLFRIPAIHRRNCYS